MSDSNNLFIAYTKWLAKIMLIVVSAVFCIAGAAYWYTDIYMLAEIDAFALECVKNDSDEPLLLMVRKRRDGGILTGIYVGGWLSEDFNKSREYTDLHYMDKYDGIDKDDYVFRSATLKFVTTRINRKSLDVIHSIDASLVEGFIMPETYKKFPVSRRCTRISIASFYSAIKARTENERSELKI